MNNFLEFIEEDILNKKTLLGSMPTNTKSNIRKFNEKIESIKSVYNEYETAVRRYLAAKSKSFMIVCEKNTEELEATIKKLEQVRFNLNPFNTYFEKIGFDTLLYKINNYHDFKFSSFNDIINEFLDKFTVAGINLTSNDFSYTCYVQEFMTSFLRIRNMKSDNYDAIAEIFEKIYWINPEIVGHIELNFRRLIRINKKKLTEYIEQNKKKMAAEYNFSYQTCLSKLEELHRELRLKKQPSISDIITEANNKAIDINNYFADSKTRIANFGSLMIDPLDLADNAAMKKFYEDLEKLKQNILEYRDYLKFSPLINHFKNEYLKNPALASKDLKSTEDEIKTNEDKLDKINKKIFGPKKSLFSKKENSIKALKFEAIKLANTLYELYQKHDQGFFDNKIADLLKDTFTVADLLNLYYSYDMFKKMALKKVFNINNFEDIKQLSETFDVFAVNPNNVISSGITLSEDNNVAKTIVNKYRIVNINITEDDLTAENLELFLEKIDFALRIRTIEESSTDVEKIWFMTQVERITNKSTKE